MMIENGNNEVKKTPKEIEIEKRKELNESLKEFGPTKKETKEEYLARMRSLLKGPKVISTVVQKGGVGKTTISSNLALSLSNLGFNVLLIDSDSQASLTYIVGEFVSNDGWSSQVVGLSDLYGMWLEDEEITAEAINGVIKRPTYTAYKGVDVIDENTGRKTKKIEICKEEFGFDFLCGDISLGDVEVEMIGMEQNKNKKRNSGMALHEIINKILFYRPYYDFVIVDAPPALGFLAYNAIGAAASGGVLVPLNLEIMTIIGCQNLIDVVANIQNFCRKAYNLNHKGHLGIIRNEFSGRSARQKNLDEVVKGFFPIPRFESTIPSKDACNKAHGVKKLYQQESKEVKETFDIFAKEVLKMEIERAEEKESPIYEINQLYRYTDNLERGDK